MPPPQDGGEAGASAKKRKRRHTTAPLHEATHEAATGAGAAAAAAPGRKARAAPGTASSLWDLSTPAPAGVAPQTTLRTVPRSAPAAAALEVLRARALDRLRAQLHALCVAAGLEAPPQLGFERWRFCCKTGEEAAAAAPDKPQGPPRKRPFAGPADGTDPVLPCGSGVDGGDGGGLAADLVRAGLAQAPADSVAAALHAASLAEVAAICATAQRLNCGVAAPKAPGKAVAPEAPKAAFRKHSVDFSLGTTQFVTLTRAAYGKLVALHRAHGPEEERAPPLPPVADDADDVNDTEAAADAEASAASAEEAAAEAAGTAPPRAALHARLFALLLRHKAMKGSGFQAAAGPAVFEVLRSRLGVAFECFASPLNARYSRYCSAFPDTDPPFGSAGSFFGFAPTKGAYELNPPFVPALLDRAASHALALIAAAEAAGSALTFAVVLPGWGELEGRAGLLLSPLKRLSMRVAAADHGFVDGAAHARRDPFRSSPYDTDLVVLQTAAAARKNPVDARQLEAELRAAFAACVPSEAAARRQNRLPMNRQ